MLIKGRKQMRKTSKIKKVLFLFAEDSRKKKKHFFCSRKTPGRKKSTFFLHRRFQKEKNAFFVYERLPAVFYKLGNIHALYERPKYMAFSSPALLPHEKSYYDLFTGLDGRLF
jgi:hypothetical protein